MNNQIKILRRSNLGHMLTTKIYSRCNLIGRACVVFFLFSLLYSRSLENCFDLSFPRFVKKFFLPTALIALIIPHTYFTVCCVCLSTIFFFVVPSFCIYAEHGFVFLSRLASYTRFLSIAGLCYGHINNKIPPGIKYGEGWN